MRRHGKGGDIDDAARKFSACFLAGHDPYDCPSLRLLWWQRRVHVPGPAPAPGVVLFRRERPPAPEEDVPVEHAKPGKFGILYGDPPESWVRARTASRKPAPNRK